MSHADPRLRSKVALNPSRLALDSVPGDLALQILVSHALLVISIPPAKVWLLERGVGSLWLAINVIAGGGIAVLIWIALRGGLKVKGTIKWSTFWTGAGLIVLQQGALFYALRRLPATRILVIAPFAHHFLRDLAQSPSVRSIILVVIALSSAALHDARFSIADLRHTIPAYAALLLHAGTINALNNVNKLLTLNFLSPDVSCALVVLAASVLTIPLHVFGRALSLFPPYPYVPLLALLPLPFLSFSLLFLFPRTLSSSLRYRSSFTLSYITTAIVSSFLTPLFARHWVWSDFLLIPPFYYAFKPEASSLERRTHASDPKLLLQSYLRTILASPESRKIFYFLLLNLAFMLVQMLYGVWTNSLGLISDAIHMAFDCMAIAMGLFASVMSGWERNERFTYGYGRVETLSGFANGIFLILISVFIVFEAVQRLLDPPDMNTNQLLLVSSIGLGVNLFGMFAMGGHHHHGHSHSHGHDHSSGDGHGHSHSSHKGHHGHSPSHGHSHLEHDHCDHDHDHDHGRKPENSHQYDHDHDHGHGHELDNHDHSHDHSHSHGGHDHSHSHGHSHSSSKPRKLPEPLTINPQPYLGVPGTPSFHTFSPNNESADRIADVSPAPSGVFSPITPSYSFTHDPHITLHHPEIHNHHGHSDEGHSHNMRGVFLHVLADTLGSVGVILSTLLIRYYGWTGFDPIASLFIAVLIAASVWPLVQETGRLLGLDLGDEGEKQVRAALNEVGGVHGVAGYSAPRFWMRDTGVVVGSLRVHLESWFVQALMKGGEKGRPSKLDGMREGVEQVLKAKIRGLEEVVIQLDG